MLAGRLLGCPALPDRPLLPDTRPGCRLPGSPAVPGVAPGTGTQSRYPSGVPVTRLPSRSQSYPEISIRSRHPSEAPVTQLLSRFRSRLQNWYLFTRYPSRMPVARLPGRFRSCLQNWYLFSEYPSEVPVARLPGRSRSFPRERYPSLAVMNFYRLRLTRHKGFLTAISRFFGHPQDTRSYPPRPAVFPPSYPQIRPQTVEFPGFRALSCRRR
jgi:hypothetical protein